jgi:cytochrome c553
MKRIVAILAAATFLPVNAAGQDVADGERYYIEYLCYACHGYGGTNLQQPLVNGLSGIMVNETVFITFLRQRDDVNPATATRAMPNYAVSTLSDRQARDLYAYIKSLKDSPPEVADDPLMQKILDAAKAQQPSGE